MIVGQLLEYAAHASETWTADELRARPAHEDRSMRSTNGRAPQASRWLHDSGRFQQIRRAVPRARYPPIPRDPRGLLPSIAQNAALRGAQPEI